MWLLPGSTALIWAAPPGSRRTTPRTLTPARKVTVPVGTPAAECTEAVNVTATASAAGLAEETTVVALAARTTAGAGIGGEEDETVAPRLRLVSSAVPLPAPADTAT